MSQRNISEYLSKKIAHLMFIMSLFVVYIHMYDGTLINQGGFFNRFQDVISQGICRCAVPLFFVISGFLAFSIKNINGKMMLMQIPKRLKSLGIPYLFWNVFYFIFFTCINWLLSLIKNTQYILTLSVPELIKIVFLYSNNAPFWYMFQLLILAIISPLLFYILKNKYSGFVFILLTIAGYLFITENDKFLLLPGIMFYYIGAFMALNFLDIFGVKLFRHFWQKIQ